MSTLDDLIETPKDSAPRVNPIIGTLILIGIIALVSSILLYIEYTKQETNIEVIEIIKPVEDSVKTLQIDISGAVKNPGLYSLQTGSRVNDIILLSGGLREDANREWIQKQLNLAETIRDGQKIYIPFEGETAPVPVVYGVKDGKININSASQKDLESLPKIGPVTAEKILKYRQEKGGFQSLEELMQVEGIGQSTFEAIADRITL